MPALNRSAASSPLPAVVVGAGPAGLAVSHALTRAGVEHLVLERGRIGETWRTQRWASFRLNTPRWANRLPGMRPRGAPETFDTADDLIAELTRYAADRALPVVQQAEVVGLNRRGRAYVVATEGGRDRDARRDRGERRAARAAAARRRTSSATRHPQPARGLPATRPSSAPALCWSSAPGRPAARSQRICSERGRRVFLATSRVGRIPRRYRGRDIIEWWRATGYLDQRPGEVGAAATRATQPQVSGTRGGHTISLQALARDGATLLGHVAGIDGRRLLLAPGPARQSRPSRTPSRPTAPSHRRAHPPSALRRAARAGRPGRGAARAGALSAARARSVPRGDRDDRLVHGLRASTPPP